jgi:enamine deaminase RidA (YjgF/YER057c/UK114 family)
MSRACRLVAVAFATWAGWAASVEAQQPISPGGVRTLSPPGAIQLVAGDEARVRQAFRNMELIAKSEGADLRDAVRLVVYVTDMYRFRPIVNKVQEELWGQGPYPPRTILEVQRLNQDDIAEVEGTFYAPPKR